MRSLYMFLASMGIVLAASAAHNPKWVRFSQPSNYANFDVTEVAVKVDTFGNVYTAASILDTVNSLSKAMIVKYDTAGNLLWTQTFYDSTDQFNNDAHVVSLLADDNGNSYVCGYAGHNITTAKDFMVIKYNKNGVFQWVQYWDGNYGTGYDDIVTAACFDKAGNIILAGYSQTETSGDDIAVAAWSLAGTSLWSYTYNYNAGNDEDRAAAVASDLNNNIFITGSSYDQNSRRDVITLKVNSMGIQWTKRLTYSNDTYQDYGTSITTDSFGNSYVTGSASQAAGTCVAIKYDSSGNEVWNRPYAGVNSDAHGTKIMLDKHGNVIIVGFEFISTALQNDYMIVKYNNAGTFVWGFNFDSGTPSESVERAYDAAIDTNGAIYVTGSYDGDIITHMQTIMVSPAGQLLWNTPYANNLDTLGLDQAYSMVLDKYFNIIVAGVSITNEVFFNNVNVVTLKYTAPSFVSAITEIQTKDGDLNIYPNPTSGSLTLSVSDEHLLGSEISVNNLLGEYVITEKLTELTQHLDLSKCAKGLYIVNIKNDNTSISKKLVLE